MDNALKIFSKGWNFSQDGPGNRLLYHFQGCNFTCPWCSNPEGMALAGSLLAYPGKLTEAACPHGAIHGQTLDRNLCGSCTGKECLGRNRNEGIRFSAQEYTIDAILSEIESARELFHSGGGVTFTGGEPTLQFNPLKALLEELKRRGIHTVIETNGSSERLPELFGRTGLLIIDLKHPDTHIHRKVLGTGNEKVVGNIQAAAASGIDTWVRIPLIPGFNDDAEVIRQIIQLIKPLNRPGLTVELLPYHAYGKVKWEQIGKEYAMPDRKIPAGELEEYKRMFREHQITVIKT